jgi:hypothetical protein
MLGHHLIQRGTQRSQRVRWMIEAFGTRSIAGHRDHEAAHVSITLSGRQRRNFCLGFESGRHADFVTRKRRQKLCVVKPLPDARRSPQILSCALHRAVLAIPRQTVGPVKESEERILWHSVRICAVCIEHGFERRQRKGHREAVSRTSQKATTRQLQALHGITSLDAAVRNPSLLTSSTSSSRN